MIRRRGLFRRTPGENRQGLLNGSSRRTAAFVGVRRIGREVMNCLLLLASCYCQTSSRQLARADLLRGALSNTLQHDVLLAKLVAGRGPGPGIFPERLRPFLPILAVDAAVGTSMLPLSYSVEAMLWLDRASHRLTIAVPRGSLRRRLSTQRAGYLRRRRDSGQVR